MQQPFKHIGIFGKRDDLRISDTLLVLRNYLLQNGYQISVDEFAAGLLNVPPTPEQTLLENIDVGIVVGGDGTLLSTGRLLSSYKVPVIGINMGRLGFLVDISPTRITTELDQILQGEYILEERSLLYTEAYREGELLGSGKSLNDVVIRARDQVRMIEFTTYIDDHFVNTQHADGLVITTPTGSTAYALSSGGPILHPSLPAIALVPICPHTLTQRPLVIGLDSKIEIQLNSQRTTHPRLSLDGHNNIDLLAGDNILVRQSEDKMSLLHPQNYDYYNILRTKLHWGLVL